MPPKDLNEERGVDRKVMATHPTAQHFVQDNTESPEVGFEAVLMFKEDFGGRECWCTNTAARELRFRSTVAEQPGNTKVAENNVSVRIDEDVLLFYVSMYDILGMNVLDSKKLCCQIRGGQIIDSTAGLTSSAI